MAKRRSDWLVGRLAAKSVVAAALADGTGRDWPLGVLEIASEASGRPCARIAPEAAPVAGFAPGERLPITVSISHAEGHALCAAAWTGREDGSRRALGIDLGLVEPRSREFVATFLTPDERRFVDDAPPRERALRANLVWCGKEAVLKAFGLGLTVDTYEVSCLAVPGRVDLTEWPMTPRAEGWRPFVATCGPALATGGAVVRGVWRSFGGFVGALAATPGARPGRARPPDCCHTVAPRAACDARR